MRGNGPLQYGFHGDSGFPARHDRMAPGTRGRHPHQGGPDARAITACDMTDASNSWRPTATRAMLETRAAMLARARQFFAELGVLEVDTPVVVNAPVTDVHIHSARVTFSSH